VTNEVVLKVRSNKNGLGEELVDLVTRCYQENPDKKDLRELRRWLDDKPGLYKIVFDFNDVIRGKILDNVVTQRPARMAIDKNVEDLKQGMLYDQSPVIEKLLIDQVINAWLRLQWAEFFYTQNTEGRHSMSEGEYWGKVLNSAQRRYLRAVETLARVRKITRATMQINIAEPGSQQVNVAGDFVHNKGNP